MTRVVLYLLQINNNNNGFVNDIYSGTSTFILFFNNLNYIKIDIMILKFIKFQFNKLITFIDFDQLCIQNKNNIKKVLLDILNMYYICYTKEKKHKFHF